MRQKENDTKHQREKKRSGVPWQIGKRSQKVTGEGDEGTPRPE